MRQLITIIDITIDVVELPSARGYVVSPVALILGTIRPDLDAKTVSDIGTNFKLTLVDSPISVYDLLSELQAILFQQ